MKQVYSIKELCLSCHQCETSCAIEHSHGKTLGDALTEPVTPASRISIRQNRMTHRPVVLKCRHCNPAPCIRFCTAGALRRDFSTGYVVVNEQRCIGCRVCLSGCQFGVIRFARSFRAKGTHTVAVKCDGCIDRIRNGGAPACVESCSTGALVYSSPDEALKNRKKTALELCASLEKKYTEGTGR